MNDEIKALLERIEWAGYEGDCPDCDERPHAEGCALARLLGRPYVPPAPAPPSKFAEGLRIRAPLEALSLRALSRESTFVAPKVFPPKPVKR